VGRIGEGRRGLGIGGGGGGDSKSGGETGGFSRRGGRAVLCMLLVFLKVLVRVGL